MKPKVRPVGRVRVDAYRVIADAVENGISYGYHRAYKYTDKPDEQQIKTEIYQAVMQELCEWLAFDD